VPQLIGAYAHQSTGFVFGMNAPLRVRRATTANGAADDKLRTCKHTHGGPPDM